MGWIRDRLKMTNEQLEKRAQELRDIAKNARSKTESVMVDLRNEPKPLSNESKVIKPTTGNTIPEGYTKNAF
jgi:hypothetical protein